MTSAANEWTRHLQQWGIPPHILDQAPQSPWIHPVETFRVADDTAVHVDSPSRHRALEALTGITTPSVLDVGCGGGRAALGLVPPATHLVGVDHQQGMLDLFSDAAHRRHVTVQTVLGDWPDVAAHTPICDVVVCHHVFFNVQQLMPFAAALTSHARHRVVVEMPVRHPLSSLSTAWRHFWGFDRPTEPTAHDAVKVLAEGGIKARIECWDAPSRSQGPVTDLDVEHTRIRLCLGADRDAEVRSFLESQPTTTRSTATLWWDTIT